MPKNLLLKRTAVVLMLLMFLSTAWLGCASTVKERQEGQPATGKPAEAKLPEGEGQYYLDDVRVPSELNYQPKDSFVYETPKFKTGILVFTKWRVDIQSLINYFTYNMPQDNWKLVNSFKGEESYLNFSKPDKSCTIRIIEKWYGTTIVEIRVGPLGEKKM